MPIFGLKMQVWEFTSQLLELVINKLRRPF